MIVAKHPYMVAQGGALLSFSRSRCCTGFGKFWSSLCRWTNNRYMSFEALRLGSRWAPE